MAILPIRLTARLEGRRAGLLLLLILGAVAWCPPSLAGVAPHPEDPRPAQVFTLPWGPIPEPPRDAPPKPVLQITPQPLPEDSQIPFFSGDPPALDRPGFARAVAESYSMARTWFVKSISADVIFPYYFDPIQGVFAYSNSMIRQLMASRLLAEMAVEDPEILPLHRKNLDFIMKYWFREDEKGFGFIYYDNESELGANAMALRTLCVSPFYEENAEKAEKLALGIVSLVEANYSFFPFYAEPRYRYDPDYTLAYFSGEALLALVEFAEKTGREEYWELAARVQDHYLDRYVTHLSENYYPAYVPWHTFSLFLLWEHYGRPEYARAIFALNDKLLEIQQMRFHAGRFLDQHPGRPAGTHSSSDGVFTESLAYALDLAQRQNDRTHMERYLRALALAANNLIRLQFRTVPEKSGVPAGLILGAIRSDAVNPGIRIDSIQHTMDAYRKLLKLLKIPETQASNGPGTGP